MSGEIGAAGDIATGMLIGRAVEPHAGELAHGAHGHGLCLNCGTALHGEFCHACGQAGHVHRTLRSIGHDLLHGVFHFEGKVWRTLPMLVAHPGSLTRRYIAGERARFVSPLALFLFSVFLMFAVIHSTAGEVGDFDRADSIKAQSVALRNIDAKIAADTKALAPQIRSGVPQGELDRLQKELRGLQTARAVMATASFGESDWNFGKTGWAALDKGLAKAKANPGLAIYKLQSSAYKYSWALIPISVPFVALLFLWRRRFKLYDHAIFVTYSLSFMTFLVVVLSLCWMIGAPGWIFRLLLLVAPPVHMFVQLRGAYSLRKRSALWRTVALLLFAWVALLTFIALLLVMGLME